MEWKRRERTLRIRGVEVSLRKKSTRLKKIKVYSGVLLKDLLEEINQGERTHERKYGWTNKVKLRKTDCIKLKQGRQKEVLGDTRKRRNNRKTKVEEFVTYGV